MDKSDDKMFNKIKRETPVAVKYSFLIYSLQLQSYPSDIMQFTSTTMKILNKWGLCLCVHVSMCMYMHFNVIMLKNFIFTISSLFSFFNSFKYKYIVV